MQWAILSIFTFCLSLSSRQDKGEDTKLKPLIENLIISSVIWQAGAVRPELDQRSVMNVCYEDNVKVAHSQARPGQARLIRYHKGPSM